MSSRRFRLPALVVSLGLLTVAFAVPGAASALTATTTSIAASPSPATVGQPVTLTATPSVPGTVTFSYGGQVVGTGQAVGARAASGAPARIWNTDQGNIRWMATDNLGNVYVSTYKENDCGGGMCQLKQFTPSGGLNYAPFESHNGGYIWPTGLAVDSSGNIFEAFFNGPAENTIRKRTSIGATSTLFVPASAGIQRPCGMTVDANDNLYVASSINGNIYKVTPAGAVSVYATDYDTVTTFGPCSPVINKTTGVLYYLKYTELPGQWNQRGVVMQVPAGGGTPTQLASTQCYFGNWDGMNHVHRHSVQLTIDQTTGYLYGQSCEVGNASTVTQISPTGTVTEYMGAWYEAGFPTGGSNAGVGQNQTWGLAVHDGFVYLGGNALGGAHLFKIGIGALGATYTFTPTAPGSFSTGADLAPTNSGSYAGSTGSGTLMVRPAAPSAPDLAAASDLGTNSTDDITSDTTPLIEVPGSYAAGNTITVTATKSGSANVTCSYVIPATGCSLGTLADGTWSITATDTHPTGGTSAASSALSITVDATAPSAPSGVDLATGSDSGSSSTDNATSDTTPTMSASGGSTGDTMTMTATNGTTTISCSYVLPASSCTMPTMTDGTWSVTATRTDPAGNTSTASSALSMTIDSTGPAGLTPDLLAGSDLGSSSTDNITSDNTPTITIPGQATGDVVTVTASKSGSPDVTCTYTVGASTNCTLGTLGDGAWTISASITDLAGNTGTTLSLPVSIDSTAPSAPTGVDLASASDLGSSATDNVTSDSTPTMSAAGGSNGDTVTITATKGASTVTCTYVVPAASCDLGTLSDGTWNVSSTLTDPAGNTSSASPALPISIDTVAPSAPGAPDLASASDTGSSSTDDLTSDSTPRIDVPGGTTGDTITVTATPAGGGTPVTCTFVVGAATGCDLGPLADGQWTTSATATDPAGNVGPATAGPSLSIDATAPTGPATPTLDPTSDTGTSSTDRVTADTTPTMHVPDVPTGETITLNATGPNGQTASCTFVASATVDSCDLGPLADGSWSISASSNAVDGAGNQATPSAPVTIDIAATAPTAPARPKPVGDTTTDSSGTAQTMDTTPRFTVPGAAAPNTITLNAVGPGGLTATCSYTPSATVTGCTLGPLADGLWTITPTQTNPAGVVSPAGAPYTIRIGPEPKPNLPPDPYKTDVSRQADGSGYDATAWFAVPVDPSKVDAVIFVITDRNGNVIGRIRKPVTDSMTKATMRMDKLPKGAKVSAYTVNRHGVSPRAPRYANVRHVDTRRNRTALPNGGYRLLGSPLGEDVIFEGASHVLTADAKTELDRLASIAKRKGGQLYITGFARRNGINSDGWLLRLSKRRAEAVATYLADRGVTGWITWNGVGPATQTIGTPENRNVVIRWAPVR